MKTIYAKHAPYDDGTLGLVCNEMELCGAPTIRVIQIAECFYAVEGSHRLASAHYLGLEPKLIVLHADLPGIPRISQDLPVYDFTHVWVIES